MSKHYQDNLKRTETVNKIFAGKIDGSKLPDNIEYMDNRSNFLIKKGDKIKTAYNMEQLNNELEILKNGKFFKGAVTVLVGIGNGKTIKTLLKAKEKGHIVVAVEPITYFIKKFMEDNNLKKYQNDGSVIFVQSKDELAPIFTYLESRLVVEAWTIGSESYIFEMPDTYYETLKTAQDLINQIQCNVGTVIGAGVEIAENDIKNLPYIIRHRGVKEIEGLFKKKHAIVVSTGPSLQKNIHILKKYERKVIIIAVAQALRALLAYDIKPDFVCTVDYGKTNLEHFVGLFDYDIPLVALNRSYAGILKRWKGQKFITVSEPYGVEGSINDYISHKGCLAQGGSVSHLCLGLALHLGCKSVALIGQDLSYEGSDSHIPLADAGGKINHLDNGLMEWDVNDPQSHLKGLKNSMGVSQEVQSYFDDGITNGKVLTNIGLMSFITSFESIAAGYENIDFYNCTEGGAKIKNFKNKSLRDHLKKIKMLDIPSKGKVKRYSDLVPDHISQIEGVMVILEREMDDFETIIEHSKKALSTCKKLIKRKLTSNEKKLLLKENEKFSIMAQDLAKKNSLLGLHIYKTSREIQKRELNVKKGEKHLLKNKEDLKTRVKRNEMILNAAIKGSERLLELYTESYELLDTYLKTKEENLLKSTDVEINYLTENKIDEYFDNGNWAYPLIYARHMKTIKDMDIDKAFFSKIESIAKEKRKEAIYLAERSYKEREKEIIYSCLVSESKENCMNLEEFDKDKFKTSEKMLRDAIKIFPEEYSARWGLATTLHHVKEYEESAKVYKDLMEQFPDFKRIKFEYGLVLLANNNKEGFEHLKELFTDTDEFDHYLFKYGKLCEQHGLNTEAKIAYDKYLEKFPDNQEAKKQLEELT